MSDTMRAPYNGQVEYNDLKHTYIYNMYFI